MISLCQILLYTLPLAASVLAKSQPVPTKAENAPAEHHTFQELLNALPEESLHAALHDHHPQYQDGVFEKDRKGIESIHHEDPPLATKLLEAAKLDLAKRQASNATSSAAPPPNTEASSAPPQSTNAAPPQSSNAAPPQSSNAAPPSSSGPPPVVIPVSVSTTNSKGQATVVNSEIISQPTVSVAIPVTRTNAAGQTFVSTSNAPGVVMTATDSAGSVFVTTSAASPAPTPGQVLTETDAHGSTFLTTYTPGGGAVSSVVLITTTGPNGQVETLTSYAYVGATGTDSANGENGPATSTRTGKPGLQTGAAGVLSRSLGFEAAAVVGGAVGLAWLL